MRKRSARRRTELVHGKCAEREECAARRCPSWGETAQRQREDACGSRADECFGRQLPTDHGHFRTSTAGRGEKSLHGPALGRPMTARASPARRCRGCRRSTAAKLNCSGCSHACHSGATPLRRLPTSSDGTSGVSCESAQQADCRHSEIGEASLREPATAPLQQRRARDVVGTQHDRERAANRRSNVFATRSDVDATRPGRYCCATSISSSASPRRRSPPPMRSRPTCAGRTTEMRATPVHVRQHVGDHVAAGRRRGRDAQRNANGRAALRRPAREREQAA